MVESMATLDAVVESRLEQIKEERCLKQKNKVRLTADPSISVASLVAILVAFLQYKQIMCLETCVEPPPSGPGPTTARWCSATAAKTASK